MGLQSVLGSFKGLTEGLHGVSESSDELQEILMIPGCFKRHPEVYVLGVLGAVSALVSQMLSWGFQNGYLLLQREFQRIPRGFL